MDREAMSRQESDDGAEEETVEEGGQRRALGPRDPGSRQEATDIDIEQAKETQEEAPKAMGEATPIARINETCRMVVNGILRGNTNANTTSVTKSAIRRRVPRWVGSSVSRSEMQARNPE